jgi:uncharacterized protein (TIGR03435 family)
MKPEMKNIDEVVKRHMPSASRGDMESDIGHVFHQLQLRDLGADYAAEEHVLTPPAGANFRWRIGMVAAAAAVLLAVFIGTVVWRQSPSFGVVENEDGSLYRVVEGKAQAIQQGTTLAVGETVRSNGSAGGTLSLADGSRVEMRSQSEFTVERANDGIRIRLIRGSIIVNAAKQFAGHLYVQTKDVIVSVVGTVFLVNAEEEGSRVAVIEGEVRVQQGTTTRNLLPGEQVATNPKMESLAVKEEIAWSRNADVHVALLQQSTISIADTSQKPEERLAFEVVSIRSSRPPAGGGGRGGGGEPCTGGGPKIDPRRFAVTNATLYNLITTAYNLGGNNGGTATRCANARALGTLSGGPDWNSARFDIEGVIPEGLADYTVRTVGGVSVYEPGPKLQKMLQAMLAERFNLVMRRDIKEMPVYALTVAKNGPKLTPWKEGDPVNFGGYSEGGPSRDRTQLVSIITGNKAPIAQLAGRLEIVTQRPVLDRSGILGEFTFRLEFAPPPAFTGFPSLFPGIPVMTSPSVFKALEEQLGLKLEAATAPVEVLAIERVEKPSEN